MGWQAVMKTAQKATQGQMDYVQVISQLGQSVVLGVLLMQLTFWVTRRTASLRARERDDSPTESFHGAISVLFFCFGMTGVMILVQDSIARAFAIGAAIALVRFRIRVGNVLSSAFLFSVVIGMACGVGNLPVAWSLAALYSLVSIIVFATVTRQSLTTPGRPTADLAPGQLIRNAKGNWTCQFPRYMATVDGVTGKLTSLLVKGDELIRRVTAESSGSTQGATTFSTSVAEFDSPYARQCGLLVSHPGFSLWWHFLSDGIIIECTAASESAPEMIMLFTRNLGPLSRPYPARSRYLRELVRQDSAMTGDTGKSAVTRGGTPVVFYAPDIQTIGQGSGKQAHGIILSGAIGVRCAAEIQIGPATPQMPAPSIP